MKMYLFIIFYILLFYSKLAFCQQEVNKIISIPLIESIDSNFTKIVDRHIEVLKSRNISTDSTIIIQVSPYVLRSSGVPKNIIDSLYAENKFPNNENNAGYLLYVTTMPFNYSGHCHFEDGDSLYLFEYKGKQVMVTSNLKLDFKLKGKKEVIVCGEGQLENFPPPEFMTFYYWFWRGRISEFRTFPLYDND